MIPGSPEPERANEYSAAVLNAGLSIYQQQSRQRGTAAVLHGPPAAQLRGNK
jgi:hypothetical protein